VSMPTAGDRVELRGGHGGRVIGSRDGMVVVELHRDAVQLAVDPDEIVAWYPAIRPPWR
jgi:preprotein translocase subunit YajC